VNHTTQQRAGADAVRADSRPGPVPRPRLGGQNNVMRSTSFSLVLGVILSVVLASTVAVLMRRADREDDAPRGPSAAGMVLPCPPEMAGGFGGPLGESVWEWYRTSVGMMGEPVLACGPSDDYETYRLIWVHSFTTRFPLVVRLSKTQSGITLRGARFTWNQRPRSVTTVSNVARHLTPTEWMEFLGQVRRSGFWSMPGTMMQNGDDGSSWLLEARRGADYVLVARHSPGDGPFRSVAMELVSLAGFDDPEPRSR